jgi:hypothetical protein
MRAPASIALELSLNLPLSDGKLDRQWHGEPDEPKSIMRSVIMDYKIPQETKDRWLPLLESGEVKQASGALFNDCIHGYCCLGVYAKACGARFFREEIPVETSDGEINEPQYDVAGDITIEIDSERWGHLDLNNNELLDEDWANDQGISPDVQKFLSSLNDGCAGIAVKLDSPLIDLWRKHSVHTKDSSVSGCMSFSVRQHSFAEIARIIREDL